jgi:phosphoenolpyruvate-protein phosphotransferase (PTS system enzyme I)
MVENRIISGVPVSPGIGFGRACFFQEKIPVAKTIKTRNQAEQINSLENAFSELSNELSFLAKQAEANLDQSTAEIFNAHKMIIDCAELQQDIADTIAQAQLSAIDAVEQCFNDYFHYFKQLSNDYMTERSHDFTELKNLLLNLLNNTQSYLYCRDYEGCQVGECALGNPHILVAGELTANVAIKIRKPTKGIITERCGMNSHAAVIARSLNIPVVSGIENPVQIIPHNQDILIDGDSGDIVINPDKATVRRKTRQGNKYRKSLEVVEPVLQFKVLADIDRYDDVQKALRVKADGIGLYRTEFELLYRDHNLSEQEQTDIYQGILTKMQGKPVYIRLFDLGSDKAAPWLDLKEEENPALGCRGARLLLMQPEMVRTQARAIAKASRVSPVNVIYPMISTLEQFIQLRKLFLDSLADLEHVQVTHGIMFEVPSACMQADELYEEIDFGRIGCNDLVQYLFAYDRTSDDFSCEDLAKSKVLWNLIGDMALVAKKAGKPLELCGYIVNKPEFTARLVALGIDTVSTGPENIAAVRRSAKSCLTDPVIHVCG